MTKLSKTMLIKALMIEAKESGGKITRKNVDGDLWLYVEAFGHKYIIKRPYTAKCEIIQEDITP